MPLSPLSLCPFVFVPHDPAHPLLVLGIGASSALTLLPTPQCIKSGGKLRSFRFFSFLQITSHLTHIRTHTHTHTHSFSSLSFEQPATLSSHSQHNATHITPHTTETSNVHLTLDTALKQPPPVQVVSTLLTSHNHSLYNKQN